MILRHKNRELLRYEWTETGGVRLVSVEESARRWLPLEFGEASAPGDEQALADRLASWLNHRTSPMGRHFMRDLMASLGLNMRDPEFHRKALAFSKGLSLNDVYWTVPDEFASSWEDCNLYANEFSKSMAEIAFSGHGSRRAGEVTTSPEMTTNGMLPKCWRRVDGQVLLYKGGTGGASERRGLEPYSEFYAAQIAEALGFAHVDYGLARYKGSLCSTCPLFTNERIGYLPAARMSDRRAVLQDSRFSEIFLFDALVFNTDRHLGNFGYLVDNETNQIVGTAPIFDNGFGLFALAECDSEEPAQDFRSLKAYLRGKHPALFDHWLGFPGGLNSRLLMSVERLRGFRFHVHPHYNLPRERLTVLERFLQKRVSDILEYGEKADDCLKVSESRVGVKNKKENTSVGVGGNNLDALALQMIWNMKANPFVTARELAEILGVEVRTVERRVRVLREEGVVRRVGAAKTGHWEVIAEF